MKVDFVITELYVGGAERCLIQLASGLAKRGEHVRVFSLGSLPSGQQRALVEQLEDAGIDVASGMADRSHQLFRAYRRLKTWLKEGKPDVCQTFLHHANVVGTYAAKACDVPVRVGGLRVAEDRPFRSWLERGAAKHMQKMICVSEAVSEFAQNRLAISHSRVVVIPNCVDVQRYDSVQAACWSELDWPENSKVLLFVGRLHPQKGIDSDSVTNQSART